MVLGSLLSAAGVNGAGSLPTLVVLVTSAAPVACSSAMPAPDALTPAGAVSATTSPSRCERAQESYRPERRRRQSFGWGKSRSGGKRGGGRSPSPACSAHSASVSASWSAESSDSEGRVSVMSPPPSRRHSAGGGRSESACSASGRARSPQPGPVGLGSSWLHLALTGPARRYEVTLPPPLRVWGKTTVIVSPIRSIWTGMTRSGLFSSSSGSSIAWRNRQV